MANKKRMTYNTTIQRLKRAARDRKLSDYLWEMLSLQVIHFESNPDMLNDMKLKDMLDVARLCRDVQEIEEVRQDTTASEAFEQRLKELRDKAS